MPNEFAAHARVSDRVQIGFVGRMNDRCETGSIAPLGL
jgi:hypothetical protein